MAGKKILRKVKDETDGKKTFRHRNTNLRYKYPRVTSMPYWTLPGKKTDELEDMK